MDMVVWMITYLQLCVPYGIDRIDCNQKVAKIYGNGKGLIMISEYFTKTDSVWIG